MYIRTKDGVYLKIRECDENNKILIVGKTITDFGTYIEKKDIITQSEDLELLCDEFVLMERDAKPIIFKTLQGSINNKIYDDEIIYGAIWTDKGLIYVAKMNEKGELELI